MCRIKRHLEAKKSQAVPPCLRKKILSLVQANAMQRNHRIGAFENVFCQTLSRNRTLLQPNNFFIQIPMIEFATQRTEADVNFVVADQRRFVFELFRSESKPCAIIMSVN